MNYRPEIDGLRSLAVIPVILFHAGISGFAGGFVGVDVFFVISGFLITSILKRDIDSGEFTLLGFWERRARRILPPLAVVVLATLTAALFFFTPGDFRTLSQAVAAQSLFVSNIFHWSLTGYFGPASAQLPLLHTWSLSVEEQFYILFPVSFMLVTMFVRRARWHLISAVTLISLAVSILYSQSSPIAAFYLMPTRAWELGVGSLLCLLTASGRVRPPAGWPAESISALGLGLIAYAVFAFNDRTVFPGFAALVPVFGTALFIWSNTSGATLGGKLLSRRLPVFIGLISYSLYLWHWPVLVFAAYPSGHSPADLSTVATVVAIAVSVALAFASWRFIEAPVRKRRILPRRSMLLGASTLGLFGLASLGVVASQQAVVSRLINGDAAELAENAKAMSERQTDCHRSEDANLKTLESLDGYCVIGPASNHPSYILWGDSHAVSLLPMMDELSARTAVPGIYASMSSCPPILGVTIESHSSCNSFNEAVLRQITESQVPVVVLSGSWADRWYDGVMSPLDTDEGIEIEEDAGSQPASVEYFGSTVRRLIGQGFDVWIVRDAPAFDFDPPQRLFWQQRLRRDLSSVGMPYEAYLADMADMDHLYSELDAEGANIIDLPAALCQDGFCSAYRDGVSLYRDFNHLSIDGSLSVSGAFKGLFDILGVETPSAPLSTPQGD